MADDVAQKFMVDHALKMLCSLEARKDAFLKDARKAYATKRTAV